MTMTTFEMTLTMRPITCYQCGLVFGVPYRWDDERRKLHDTFYCPNGHAQAYHCQSEAEKLRDELAAQKRRTEYFEADAQRSREREEAAKRQARAARGVVTRVKNRVGRGVCPCCNRFFECLHRHMETKHPEYVATDGEKATA